MDTAIELAKCREAAEGLYLGVCGDPHVKRERVVTALLAARADALGEASDGWDSCHPVCVLAEEMGREVRNRRICGL